MPVVHCEPFRAHYYECDAHGHLTQLSYLRWMQEAAYAASVAVGYDLARYTDLSHVWVIRETRLDHLRPVRYEDQIMVQTWVADFRRWHSQRRYDFIQAGSGEIAARASTDWVYLQLPSHRPATVPLDMQRAFCPEGNTTPDIPLGRFPAQPPAPPNAFSLHTRVDWPAIDTIWAVNNTMYLAYLEEAGLRLGEAIGWPMARTLAAGFGTVARQLRIEYRIPARLDDELDVTTWFSGVRPASALQHYGIYRAADRALLARARTRWVWIDLETRRPIHIPPDLLKALSTQVSQE